MPHDPSIYRAIDPDFNMSLTEAKGLAAKLALMGFIVRAIICNPQGDGKGFGLTGDVSAEEVLASGISADEPIHLHFRFQGLRDDQGSHNCQLVKTTYGKGGYLGFQRVHDALYPGDPTAHLVFLLRQPGASTAMDLFLNGELDDLVKPAAHAYRPQLGFNVGAQPMEAAAPAPVPSSAPDAAGSTGAPSRFPDPPRGDQ